MKMVAVSKLRAIQTRAENSCGLWQPFTALLGDTPRVDVKKNFIVTISSDKGLCGGINSTSAKINRALHKLNSGPEKDSIRRFGRECQGPTCEGFQETHRVLYN